LTGNELLDIFRINTRLYLNTENDTIPDSVTFLFFCTPALCGFAQTKIIDGFKTNVRAAKTNEEKVKAIFALCELGYTLNPDTLMAYAENARLLAGQLNNLHDEVQAMYYESGALTTRGLIDSSLATANKCLDIYPQAK
jgi:hypothetical protein